MMTTMTCYEVNEVVHPTLKDIAQLAGVSPKTVSRVINQEYLVKETNRKKVQKIVRKHGYQPKEIERGPEFSALFSANSLIALGVLKAMRAYGLSIRRDIDLVSFDGMDFTEVTEPPLTTTVEAEEAIGCEAVKLLLSRLKQEKDKNGLPSREILVPVKLVLRESCGYRISFNQLKKPDRAYGRLLGINK